jgi:hypothetical protein
MTRLGRPRVRRPTSQPGDNDKYVTEKGQENDDHKRECQSDYDDSLLSLRGYHVSLLPSGIDQPCAIHAALLSNAIDAAMLRKPQCPQSLQCRTASQARMPCKVRGGGGRPRGLSERFRISRFSMAAQAGPDRIRRGTLGAFFGFVVSFAFALGLSVRACLPDRPELLWTLAFEFLFVGFIIYVPAIVVGFLIGYFTRLKVLLILALVLLILAFAIGYAIARDGCVPL